ncbi:Lipoprotein LipO [Meiothermus luteus]|jgi:putative aldouronate transport system substrate-binding protein|uniref:Lipoprotein LipO n=1 Tax=Meiothermus luteus TaxID=2026184 RepID=A0A399EWP3_9DEIN|nr:extracellular solute-binding protein [Meiothermus luteus]RIH88468.1 Lipoprotein LipO [Meiothermus luteus]RMH57332.1 MAG: extracellular solute-binding protein [Deinococcota bacterium]
MRKGPKLLLLAAVLATLAAKAQGPTELHVALYAANPEAPAPPPNWEVYQILRDKLGINLKFTMLPTGADGDNRLGALAAANDLPDLFEVRSLALFDRLLQQGQLAPVNKLFPQMPRRTQVRYSDPRRNRLVSVRDQIYGLQERVTLSRQYAIWVRKDWLDRLGLQPPSTLEEFFQVAKAFTERDPDGNGRNDTYGFGGVIDYDTAGILPGLGLGNHFQWVYGAYGVAGTWNYDPRAFAANLRDPNFRRATEFIRRLVEAKVIDPDWATLRRADLRTRWQQGRYGMFFESVGGLQAGLQNFYANNPNAELIMLAPPKGPEGKSSMGTYSSAGWLFVVSKRAMDSGKDAAIARFLEWAHSGEGYYLLGWGRKGQDYILVNNVPTVNTQVPISVRGSYTQMRWLAFNANPIEMRGRYPEITVAGRKFVMYQLMEKAQAQGNWINRTGDVAVKAAPNQADIERYVAENLVQFVLGQRPINDTTWRQFLDGLRNLRFEQYEAAAERTLREYGYLLPTPTR